MALKDVKQDILDEAEQKAQEIRSEADQEAEEILDEARDRAREIEKKREEDLEEEKDKIEKRSISEAEMEARDRRLELKGDIIDDVFENFRSRISDLDEPQRSSFVEEAVDSVEFEVDSVEASEDYMDLSTEHDTVQSDVEGFVLVSEDGSVRQSFTTEKILDSFREGYKKQVADLLFGEP